MAISAQDVNKLRKMTGAGMMDCKKALTEANGDFDSAIAILRKKGQKVSASRSDRETNEGMVFINTNAEGTEAILVAIGCETDFVAKNSDFQDLGNSVLQIAVDNKPADIEALKALPMDGLTVGEKIIELVGKIGEKLEILSLETLTGERVVPYVHAGSKLGVLVALSNAGDADVEAAGKDVAMQIAAMRPIALNADEVPEETKQKELEIGMDQARQEGKPEAMLEKIAQGKLKKFFKETTLLEQAFVKDPKKTVTQYLNEVNKGLTVSAFKRISVGE